MHKRMILLLFSFAFVRVMLAGNGISNAPHADEWGPVSDGCRLSVRMSKTSYRLGDQIVGTVTITNGNERSIVFPVGHKSPALDFLLVLTSEQGKPVPLSKYGESLNEFGGVADITVSSNSSHAVTLPVSVCFQLTTPGVYSLQVAHQYEIQGTKLGGKAISNTTKFEIVPAKAAEPDPGK